METIIPIFLVILFLGYLLSRVNRTDDPEVEADETDLRQNEIVNSIYDSAAQSADETIKQVETAMNQEYKRAETLELMLKALNSLGCQPTKSEDDTISVAYQGENFLMRFDGAHVRIWDTYWTRIKADDPNLPMLKDAVNDASYCFGPVMVFSEIDDKGYLHLHSIWDIVLHPAQPNIENYVKSVLDAFFDAKEELRRCYQNLEAKQADASKNHLPVSVDVNDHTCWLN